MPTPSCLVDFHTTCWEQTVLFLLTLKNSKSDQDLTSPYSDTAESSIKIMRIKEMITNLSSFDC